MKNKYFITQKVFNEKNEELNGQKTKGSMCRLLKKQTGREERINRYQDQRFFVFKDQGLFNWFADK